MKYKVALLTKVKNFEIDFQDLKKLKSEYVLVKIYKTGVCGSDLHYFRHGGLGSFKSNLPLSLGHESSGIVVDRNNTKLKNYSQVIIDPLNLSKCQYLQNHLQHSCLKCSNKVNTCAFSSYLGANSQEGTFREFIPLHYSQLTVCNDQKAFEHAQIFEPLGVAMYAVDQAKINYDKSNNIMILGAGALGLLIAETLKALNIHNITIVDKVKSRLDFAKKQIKINSVNSDNKNFFNVSKKNYDVIFDTITNQWSFNHVPNLLNNLGKFVVVGIPSQDYLLLNPHLLRIKEIELINVRRSNISMRKVLKFFYEKKINLKKYETHSFKLDEIQAAFKLSSNYIDNVIRCSVIS